MKPFLFPFCSLDIDEVREPPFFRCFRDELTCSSPSTMANFSKNKYVALSIIDKICKELDCQPGEIMSYVDESKAEIEKLEAEKARIEARIAQLKQNT